MESGLKMIKIYVDDVRSTPNGFIRFYTTNNTVDYIRRMYRAGNINFYLDLDNDAGTEFALQGGDYINILKRLEDLRYCGHLREIKLTIHIHSMNPVAKENMRAIIMANKTWMKEV